MTPLEKAQSQFHEIQKALSAGRRAEAASLAYVGEIDARRAVLQERAETPAPRELMDVTL